MVVSAPGSPRPNIRKSNSHHFDAKSRAGASTREPDRTGRNSFVDLSGHHANNDDRLTEIIRLERSSSAPKSPQRCVGSRFEDDTNSPVSFTAAHRPLALGIERSVTGEQFHTQMSIAEFSVADDSDVQSTSSSDQSHQFESYPRVLSGALFTPAKSNINKQHKNLTDSGHNLNEYIHRTKLWNQPFIQEVIRRYTHGHEAMPTGSDTPAWFTVLKGSRLRGANNVGGRRSMARRNSNMGLAKINSF